MLLGAHIPFAEDALSHDACMYWFLADIQAHLMCEIRVGGTCRQVKGVCRSGNKRSPEACESTPKPMQR